MSEPGKLAKMEQAITTFYADSTPLRTALAAVPYVGSSLDALLGTRGQNITTRRLKALVAELESQVQHLDESKLDAEFIESEDFFDLFWRMFERGVRTSQKDKVRLYVRVLLQSTQAPAHRESAQEYLELLADLTMPEIRVASAIYKRQSHITFEPENALTEPGQTNEAPHLQEELKDLTADEIDTYLKRLERTGLVREVVGSYIGYTGGAYRITEYFRNMMAYLALNDLSQVP